LLIGVFPPQEEKMAHVARASQHKLASHDDASLGQITLLPLLTGLAPVQEEKLAHVALASQ